MREHSISYRNLLKGNNIYQNPETEFLLFFLLLFICIKGMKMILWSNKEVIYTSWPCVTINVIYNLYPVSESSPQRYQHASLYSTRQNLQAVCGMADISVWFIYIDKTHVFVCHSLFFERQGPATVVCEPTLGPMGPDWTACLECVLGKWSDKYSRCVCVSWDTIVGSCVVKLQVFFKISL